MEAKKFTGDYIFTIDENKTREIEKCDIPIERFDCSVSYPFQANVVIYGKHIIQYFSRFNPFLAYDGRGIKKTDYVFDCRLNHPGDILIVELKNAMLVEYAVDSDTGIESIRLRCDWYAGLNDKTIESIIVSNMIQYAAKEAEKDARKYVESPSDYIGWDNNKEYGIDDVIQDTTFQTLLGGMIGCCGAL
jgi:hypothetical protein